MSMDTHIRTVATPPAEFAWSWALERPASEPLRVHIVPALPTEAKPLPREDELILWFGIPAPPDGPNYSEYLSENERARAAEFRFEADSWAFAAAHAGLRALLGSMLGCAPQALLFAAGPNGKPHIIHKGRRDAVQFSISHTRGCVAAAIARSAVGIDVERLREMPDLMAVARTVFAPEAYLALVAKSELSGRTALFYRYWTLCEAFMKATGTGIAQNLPSFAFTEEGSPALIRVSAILGPVTGWRFYCEP